VKSEMPLETKTREPFRCRGADPAEVSVSCAGLICGRKTDTGIRVVHAGREVGFCTNRQSIDWRKA